MTRTVHDITIAAVLLAVFIALVVWGIYNTHTVWTIDLNGMTP